MTGCKKKNADWFTWVICVMTIWNTVMAMLLDQFWHFFGGVVHGIGLVMALLFVLLKASENDNATPGGTSDKASSAEGIVETISPLAAERKEEPECIPPSVACGESFLVANDECPNGCGEGLSINYGQGREKLYCPECGWSVPFNAKGGGIADQKETK